MPAGRHNSGPLWVDGAITLRVRDRRQRAWRTVRIRTPHAVIGSHPDADLVVPRDDVAGAHAFLFLDERGLFGVDLRTDSGTRFAGSEAEAAWLGSGDLIEVGDQVIEVLQLRVGGAIHRHALAEDDPLGPHNDLSGNSPPDLTLRLLDGPSATWSIGSSLLFLGPGPACAVPVGDPADGATHAALFRSGNAAYLIPFPGVPVRINHESAGTATRLSDGDILAFGPHSLLVQTEALPEAPPGGQYDQLVNRLELAVGPDTFADIEFTFGDHRPTLVDQPIDYPALIGRLQAETAALVAVLLRRIETLDDEMSLLRDQMARLLGPDGGRAQAAPVEKLRWDLIEQSSPGAQAARESGAWLIERMRILEAERQSTWSSLMSRLGSAR